MEGDVSVTIMETVSRGDITFSYRDPEITSFNPVKGPASGGTVITINGTDLNTGRNITALLGDEDCIITLLGTNYVQCVNLKSTVNSNHTVTVIFDGNNRSASLKFRYVQDPVIDRVEPTKFIRAGGNMITISGARLDIIRHPKLIFTLHDSHFQAEENCIPINPSEMVCRSPSLAVSDVDNEINKDGNPLHLGFVMDGVTDLLNWSISNDVMFKYFRDPEYDKSDVCVDDTSDHFSNLTGRYLNDGSTPDDVTLCLGNRECQLVTLMSTYLLCERQQTPSPVGFCNEKSINEDSLVCVQHANLKFDIGTLRCSPQLTVVLSVVSACALVIAAIIFLVVYCKHKGKKQSAITQLEMEIARIENNYHEEMRRMFKNLNISALTTDGKVATLNIMPICSPTKYIEVLLYSDVHFLPSNTQSQIVSSTTLKQSLSSLSDLLGERELLEVLLHVLDNVRLEEKERFNIVSHISVFLVLDKKHALYTQILLKLSERRTENARGNELQNVFKSGNTSLQIFLCNWIALGFYDYFNDVRKPLQQCHEAIRCSVEAGPIDAVTGKSQFSINDQYLFNMQIEFDAVNLFVRFNEEAREDLVQLEFLSVDTISQVIGKILDHIYQERPYSSRPIPETFDLVWCRRDKPDRILRDDGILKLRNGWRQLNTLADYKIKSDDCIKLITKQDIESRNLDNMSETSSLISDLTKDDYIYPNGECDKIPHSHANGGEIDGYLKPKEEGYEKVSHTYATGGENDDYLEPNKGEDCSKISHSYASGVENDGYLQPKEGGGYEKVSHTYATGGENDDYLEPNKGEDYGKISHSYASVAENDGYLQPKEGGEEEEVLHSYATGKENDGYIEPIEREGEQQEVLHSYATDGDPEDIYDEPEGGLGQWIWHLEKIEDTQNDISGTMDQTVTQQHERLNEISVPYLSATTTAIQTYLNKMFTTFMTASNDQLPLSVKLIYDLFDQKASELGNPSLATTWKDDILPLGIWTHLLDKLHLIYDIKDCVYVKACIQVILQTLRDVCKRKERNISDDKPSLKGLYNELVHVYSSKLDLFYNDLKDLREVNYDTMQNESKRIEQTYQNSFDKSQVLYQLYLMIFKYRDQIYELLRRERERLKENVTEQSTSIEHLIEVLKTWGGNDGSNTSVDFT